VVERETGCLLLDQTDAWALREILLPYSAPADAGTSATAAMLQAMTSLCQRIYETLLRLELEGGSVCNMSATETDCLIINQFVKPDSWQGARSLLVQTFLVLHEATYTDRPLRVAGTALLEEWPVVEGESNALHQAGAPRDSDAKGAEQVGGAG
jgi:hypothetical protein